VSIFVDDDVLKKVAKVISGEEAVQIVMALKKFKEATDDQILSYITEDAESNYIAEDAEPKIKLNDVRRILFKLYNHSIVQCDSVRDETTGWFIFRWSLQLDQVEGFIKNQKKRILRILQTRLDYERSHDFYYCYTTECERLTFEDAMEYVFKCPTCEKLLQYFDNKKIIDALENKIGQLEKEMSE
jgi:transcription initiation factor TFIIE subunit alpha